jgi:hypothetical protein
MKPPAQSRNGQENTGTRISIAAFSQEWMSVNSGVPRTDRECRNATNKDVRMQGCPDKLFRISRAGSADHRLCGPRLFLVNGNPQTATAAICCQLRRPSNRPRMAKRHKKDIKMKGYPDKLFRISSNVAMLGWRGQLD